MQKKFLVILIPLLTVFILYKYNHLGDRYMYLEEVEGEKALQFAKDHNKLSMDHFKKTDTFKDAFDHALNILNDKDKIIYAKIENDVAYSFWRDEKNTRGIWQRMPANDYLAGGKNWEAVIDFDALAKEENENWVFQGSEIEPSEGKRAIINLSRGGKDAKVIREFNLETKKFVHDGFNLPEGKSYIEWISPNQVLLMAKSDEDSLTVSGYPRTVRVWDRGIPPKDSKLIYEAPKEHMSVWADYEFENQKLYFVDTKEWSQNIIISYDLETNKATELKLPKSLEWQASFKNQLYFIVRDSAKIGTLDAQSGDVIAVDEEQIIKGNIKARRVFRPEGNQSVQSFSRSKSYLVMNLMEDVKSKLVKVDYKNNDWAFIDLDLPSTMTNVSITWGSRFYDTFTFTIQGFLTPSALYSMDLTTGKYKLIQSLQPKFDSRPYKVDQLFSISKDGEKIPYFMVSKKDLKLDSSNPTLISAYGGFNLSKDPFYLSSYGRLWLEKGGVYVLANIRGGGEYGPKWHKAALREKRQNAFNDLYSVAEDLIAKKITSKDNLAIKGGSNGGLLTGVALTQRPDLFKAVIIAVPLLDMQRYSKLLAGHSWMAEYGDPDKSDDWEFISKYSPYHNIKEAPKYPKALIWTSTKDDRVHPGHARKMTARLEENSQPVYYYENMEGGHAGAANYKQSASNTALEVSYLYEQLDM